MGEATILIPLLGVIMEGDTNRLEDPKSIQNCFLATKALMALATDSKNASAFVSSGCLHYYLKSMVAGYCIPTPPTLQLTHSPFPFLIYAFAAK